jgi:hypothetical protein
MNEDNAMSEFRFNCSNCGQHLSGDTSYAGLQIVCPACGKTVVVPAAAPAPVAVAPTLAAALPALSPTPKTCGLAIASLICSIGSFIIIPFGFIPGIVCGHMARKKIATTPGLQGSGLAKAGLIVGYVALALQVLVIMALIAFFALFAARMKEQSRSSPRLPRSTVKAMPRATAQAEKETTDTEPDGSGWTMKLAAVEIPSEPVTGRIHRQPFKLEKVALEGGFLKLIEGKDFFADREMDIVIFENDLTRLSGRTFTVPKEGFGTTPHIYMKWKEGVRDAPKQRSFVDRYALRLEFGQLAGGNLPGKVYLCLPDLEKSFVAGTFEVSGKKGM